MHEWRLGVTAAHTPHTRVSSKSEIVTSLCTHTLSRSIESVACWGSKHDT